MKLSLSPKLFHFVKFSFPVGHLMAYYAETDRSLPPLNCKTLGITLIYNHNPHNFENFQMTNPIKAS
jgi:hypothetical protein